MPCPRSAHSRPRRICPSCSSASKQANASSSPGTAVRWAELIPFRQRDAAKVRSAIDTLRAFQETHSLGGLSVRSIVEEARRY